MTESSQNPFWPETETDTVAPDELDKLNARDLRLLAALPTDEHIPITEWSDRAGILRQTIYGRLEQIKPWLDEVERTHPRIGPRISMYRRDVGQLVIDLDAHR